VDGSPCTAQHPIGLLQGLQDSAQASNPDEGFGNLCQGSSGRVASCQQVAWPEASLDGASTPRMAGSEWPTACDGRAEDYSEAGVAK